MAHSFVDKQGMRSTFPLHEVMAFPLHEDIVKRLKYTKDILHQLVSGERISTAMAVSVGVAAPSVAGPWKNEPRRRR
jgi:hypothetical protein